VTADGTVNLSVAGVVETFKSISATRKVKRQTSRENRSGAPANLLLRGRLKPGRVFNRNTVQRDLQRVYGLGLFEDVQVSLNPGTDPRKVIVVVNVDERNSSVAAGAGISSASGLFGT